MKYIKKFESLQEEKYLIQLGSANSGGILGKTNPSEYDKRESEKWWSLGVDALHKIEIHQRYKELPNDILTKLIGCRSDIERFGPSYLTEITGLTLEQIKRFRFRFEQPSDHFNLLNRTLKKFKNMTIDQKLVFFRELESDGYLIIRNSYIYKVVDESELVDEVMSISNILDIISSEK